MGRELRMVPPNWEHPKFRHDYSGEMCDQPMYDENLEQVMEKWLAEFDRIRSGDLSDLEKEVYPRGLVDWLNDEGNPPDPAYYRPWKDEEATWFQIWQTVSEGSPVTPPFATKQELVEYLVKNGDFWDQKRGDGAWNRKSAENIVNGGYAPSFIIENGIFKPPSQQ